MVMNACPFCEMPADRIVAEKGACFAVRDRYPVSPGHMLLIPRRHVASFRELTPEEWADIHGLARQLCSEIQTGSPDVQGFNLGINDGRAAGQTIPHVHVHLIPRRSGDVRRPEGGVRGVIPGKARYPGAG